MSNDVTLDEFQNKSKDKESQNWEKVKLEDVSQKRSENVDPQDVDLNKHVGLEHIEPNTPSPKWEPLDDLSSTKRRFNSGDILFAKLRPNLEKTAQPDFEGVASTDIFPIVANNGVNSKYLLYRLSSKSAYDHARRTSAGTRMPRTSWNLFSNFSFDIPPIQEQRKIATVLSNIDQVISDTQSIIEQYDNLKVSVLQDLLKTGVSDDDCKVARIGPKEATIPEHWEIKNISEISQIKNGNRIVKGHDYADHETEYPFIRIVDMKAGTVSTTDIKYLKPETADQMQRGIIHSGDVYITVTGRVGDAGTIPEELDAARFTDNAAKLYDFEGVISEYLSLYLRSKFGQDEVHRFTVGSTQPKLSMYRVEKMEVIVPPIEEQKIIVQRITDLLSSKNLNQKYLSQLKILKQGLMQDLLSGTVRTTDTNITVPDEVAQHG